MDGIGVEAGARGGDGRDGRSTLLTGCNMAALELPYLHISLSLPSDCMQASTKAKATRKEIFKRAEQYVQEYRAQVIWAWGDWQWSEAALFWNLQTPHAAVQQLSIDARPGAAASSCQAMLHAIQKLGAGAVGGDAAVTTPSPAPTTLAAAAAKLHALHPSVLL